MGIENQYTKAVDAAIDRSQNRIEHPIIQRMHPEALRVLRESAIDPYDFIDLYGEDNVSHDLKKVEAIKSKFQQHESKAAADIFEAIVFEHVELSDWLGPNAQTIRSSEYDDYINHVDLIVEFNENEHTKHLALGVDVTFGSISMQKKFERIKIEIEKNELAKVKYFESHGFKGSLRQLPRVVIGVELEKVVALAGHWERKEKKILSEHVTKDIMLEEIERQLRTFLIYAQSIHAESAVKSYTQALSTVRSIRVSQDTTQRTSPAYQEKIQSDKVLQGILQNLERFRVTSPRH